MARFPYPGKLLFGLIFLLWTPLPAQQADLRTGWWQQQRFWLADADGNGFLRANELQLLPGEFAFFLQKDGFAQADQNQDGQLSAPEIEAQLHRALAFQARAEQQAWQQQLRAHPDLRQPNLRYLKRHPGQAAALFGLYRWVSDQTELVSQLLGDRKWVQSYPDAALALQRNLRALVEQPDMARELYQHDLTALARAPWPDWQRIHLDFMEALGDEGAGPLLLPPAPTPTVEATPAAPPDPEPAAAADSGPPPLVATLRAATDKDSTLRENDRLRLEVQRLRRDLTRLQPDPADTSGQSLSALQQRVRFLTIERDLARIEEDSLLVRSLRQQRQIHELERALTTLSQDTAGAEASTWQLRYEAAITEITQLEDELGRKRQELMQTQANRDSLQAQLAKAEYQALQAEEAGAQAAASQLKAWKQRFMQERQRATDQEIKLADFQIRLQQASQKQDSLRRQLGETEEALLNLQSAQTLTVEALEQQRQQQQALRDSMQRKVSRLENRLEKPAPPATEAPAQVAIKPLLPAGEAGLTLLQEQNSRLRTQVASLEAQRETERNRRGLEKDSLLARVDRQHQRIAELEERLEQSRIVAGAGVADPAHLRKLISALDEQIKAQQLSLQELQYDNGKLRQQLELNVRLLQDKGSAYEKRIAQLTKHNRKLEIRNERLSRRRDVEITDQIRRLDELTYQLMETRQEITRQQLINRHLRQKLDGMNEQQAEQRVQQRHLSEQVRQQKARIAYLESLKDSAAQAVVVQRQQDKTGSSMDARRKITELESSLTGYRELLAQERGAARRQADSLRHEIETLEARLIAQQQVTRVDLQRIQRLEAEEKRLEAKRRQLEERARLIEAQEASIGKRLVELARQAKRYDDLRERKKQLDLREQRLRMKEANQNQEEE